MAEFKPMSGPHVASLVLSEVQSVMAVMRQNAKWAVVPRYNDDETADDPLLLDFKSVRRKLFTYKDLNQV